MIRNKGVQAKYTRTVAQIKGCPLCWRYNKKHENNADIFYEYGIMLMTCDFPYETIGLRKVERHLMLVAKECDPKQDIKTRMMIIAESLNPNSIIINYSHHASVPDHYHIHLLYTTRH